VTLVSRETDAACIQREPAELAPAWSALAAKRQPPSIFLTPEWIAVARAHEPSQPITLSVGDRGIAAFAREADGTMTFAGGHLTDEQGVVAGPGDEAGVAMAVARWVASQRPPRVRLEFVPEARPTLDRLRLGVLSFDGADAAVLFGFALGRVIALYNAAYDPGLASLSVGIVSHAWAIREAIASGYTRYDLLRGDEPYKYDLGAHDHWLARLDAERS
jgi:CelD/BcsL family acetyltransferase involved in cellulose biosynthesis